MNKGQLRARWRRDVKDLSRPYLWSDDDFDDWIAEAEREAARRAFLLVDSTSDAAQLELSAGDIGCALDPSVIFVRRAVLSSGKPLTPRVARAMDEEVPGWENAMPSVPIVFIPDWQSRYLRFWPPTKAAQTVNLTVIRLPAVSLAEVADEDEPEIPEADHIHLLDWVKFRCYDVQDSDGYDPAKSAKHEKKFIERFGESTSIGEHWALEQYYDVGAN